MRGSMREVMQVHRQDQGEGQLEIIVALSNAAVALKVAAVGASGVERLHLEALAAANEAELRIQVKKRLVAVAA